MYYNVLIYRVLSFHFQESYRKEKVEIAESKYQHFTSFHFGHHWTVLLLDQCVFRVHTVFNSSFISEEVQELSLNSINHGKRFEYLQECLKSPQFFLEVRCEEMKLGCRDSTNLGIIIFLNYVNQGFSCTLCYTTSKMTSNFYVFFFLYPCASQMNSVLVRFLDFFSLLAMLHVSHAPFSLCVCHAG